MENKTRITLHIDVEVDVDRWNELYGTRSEREVQVDTRGYLTPVLKATINSMRHLEVVDGG